MDIAEQVRLLTLLKILACGDVHLKTTLFYRVFSRAKELCVDLIVLTGDFCDVWKVPTEATSKDMVEQVQPLIDVIQSSEIPIFFVLGNHDPPELASEIGQLTHVTNLHGRQIEFLNYTFFGVDDVHLKPLKILSCDVLVTHTPPVFFENDTVYIVSVEQHRFITRFKPLISISGHIHRPSNHLETLENMTTVLFLGDLAEEKVGLIELSRSAKSIERIAMIHL